MSEPKRYEPSTQCVEPSYQAQMIEPIVREVAWGNYVRWEDYARLKAEVERLTELFRKTERLMLLDGEYEATKVGTYARLQAQVERLTKAGDYLQRDVRLLSNDLLGKNPPTRHSEMEWNAAKGVQS